MSDLDPLRAKIDAIDSELLRLLNERATVAKEIGTIKNRDGLPIYSPERENRVLRSLVERSDGPLTPQAIRAIYREIMSASLALEKDIAIACLGPAGSPSHQAAKSKFGSSVRYLFFADVADVLAEVKADKADCGVIPIDDPDHGLANQTQPNDCSNRVVQTLTKELRAPTLKGLGAQLLVAQAHVPA